MYLHTQLDDFQCQHHLASFHIQNQISHLSNRHIPNHYRLSDFLRVSQQILTLGEEGRASLLSFLFLLCVSTAPSTKESKALA